MLCELWLSLEMPLRAAGIPQCHVTYVRRLVDNLAAIVLRNEVLQRLCRTACMTASDEQHLVLVVGQRLIRKASCPRMLGCADLA